MEKFLYPGLFIAGLILGLSLYLIPDEKSICLDYENKIIINCSALCGEIPPPYINYFAEEVLLKKIQTPFLISGRKVRYELINIENNILTFDMENTFSIENTGKEAATHIIPIGQHKDDPKVTLFNKNGTKVGAIKKTRKDLYFWQYEITLAPKQKKTFIAKIPNRKESLPFKDIDVAMLPTKDSELWIVGKPSLMEKLNLDAPPITWLDNWEDAHPDSGKNEEVTFRWVTKGYGLLPFQGAFVKISLK